MSAVAAFLGSVLLGSVALWRRWSAPWQVFLMAGAGAVGCGEVYALWHGRQLRRTFSLRDGNLVEDVALDYAAPSAIDLLWYLVAALAVSAALVGYRRARARRAQ